MFSPSELWPVAGVIGAAGLTMLFTRSYLALALRAGYLAPPDPWHSEPVALWGGLVLGLMWLAAFAWAAAFAGEGVEWALWAVPLGGLVLGIWDDKKPIQPVPKTIFQSGLAIAAMAGGLFLLPPSAPLAVNVFVTLCWFVGVSNAMNLLDNMDGLLAGVCVPIFAALAVLAAMLGTPVVTFASVVLAGACLGFLRYNVAPARVFMGDAGSMFLGFATAALVCRAATPQTSDWLVILSAAALLVGMPLYNIVFTSITRVLSGVQIARGQADHINYRLVALGTTVRRAVGTVWLGSLFTVTGGTVALLLVPRFAVIVAGVYVMYLAYMAIALNRGDTEEWGTRLGVPRSGDMADGVARWIVATTPIFAAALDAGLTAGSLLIAAAFRFDGSVSPELSRTILLVWPIFAIVRIIALWWIARAYTHVWWRALFGEYARLAAAVFASGAVAALIVRSLGFELPLSALLLEPFIALLLLGVARAAPRLIREWLYLQSVQSDPVQRERTLVVGAGDGAALLLRELRANQRHRFNVVGFVDDGRDVQKSRVGNVPILGPTEALQRLCEHHRIDRIIISTEKISDAMVLSLVGGLPKPPALSRFRVGVSEIQVATPADNKPRISLAR